LPLFLQGPGDEELHPRPPSSSRLSDASASSFLPLPQVCAALPTAVALTHFSGWNGDRVDGKGEHLPMYSVRSCLRGGG
jgi:hypothetical protein